MLNLVLYQSFVWFAEDQKLYLLCMYNTYFVYTNFSNVKQILPQKKKIHLWLKFYFFRSHNWEIGMNRFSNTSLQPIFKEMKLKKILMLLHVGLDFEFLWWIYF